MFISKAYKFRLQSNQDQAINILHKALGIIEAIALSNKQYMDAINSFREYEPKWSKAKVCLNKSALEGWNMDVNVAKNILAVGHVVLACAEAV